MWKKESSDVDSRHTCPGPVLHSVHHYLFVLGSDDTDSVSRQLERADCGELATKDAVKHLNMISAGNKLSRRIRTCSRRK